ncbi:MAG: hypothetical protein WC667_05835 [Sulfurimonas sp.]
MVDKRLLARNATLKNQDDITFNPDSFIQRLLLFDNYIMDSIRLKEITYIIDLIGYEGFIELLKSGFFQIRLETKFIAELGQFYYRPNFGKKILPNHHYSFDVGAQAVEKIYISNCCQTNSKIGQLNLKKVTF